METCTHRISGLSQKEIYEEREKDLKLFEEEILRLMYCENVDDKIENIRNKIKLYDHNNLFDLISSFEITPNWIIERAKIKILDLIILGYK